MTTEVVDRSTGEIATVDPSSELAVTSYLQQARDWLATAVETTGPEQIARAKAEIATAAEATKQLGLSKEIQDDAAEMVRRAEWALRKVTQAGQSAGTIRPNGGDRKSDSPDAVSDLPAPVSFFNSKREYEDANAMADLDPEGFESVLAEAKSEGNLSRANVAAKARQAVKAAAETLAAGLVQEFPELAFFADRGEMRRVVDNGTALRGYGPDEQARRREILRKTIEYEKRLAAKPSKTPPAKLVTPSVVSAFGFAAQLVVRASSDSLDEEIAAADRAEVADWHTKLTAALPHLQHLIDATAPHLRRIK